MTLGDVVSRPAPSSRSWCGRRKLLRGVGYMFFHSRMNNLSVSSLPRCYREGRHYYWDGTCTTSFSCHAHQRTICWEGRGGALTSRFLINAYHEATAFMDSDNTRRACCRLTILAGLMAGIRSSSVCFMNAAFPSLMDELITPGRSGSETPARRRGFITPVRFGDDLRQGVSKLERRLSGNECRQIFWFNQRRHSAPRRARLTRFVAAGTRCQ